MQQSETLATAQRTARKSANDYWKNLCSCIQISSNTGDIRGMYDGINKAFVHTTKKTAPLKSKTGETITYPYKQMDRCVDHYLDLYSRENVVTKTAINDAEPLPVMRELDELPSEKKLSDAIDRPANGKAPGNDGISPEMSKYAPCASHKTP